MDTTANPGENFHRYANGKWIDNCVIPAEYPRWGAFLMLREASLNRQHDLLEALVHSTETFEPGSNRQKLRDFYASGMNEAQIEAAGGKPLESSMARINGVRSMKGLVNLVARLHNSGTSGLFGFGGSPSYDDSNQVIAHAAQGGIGLPDRDYYLENDAATIERRAKYAAHIAKMFQLVGLKQSTAQAHAQSVLKIETAMATAFMPKAELRDPQNRKNPMTVEQFAALVPAFDMRQYFKALGAPEFDTINVHQPKYFQALNTILTSTSLREIKVYLRWSLLRSAASYLSSAFVNENFDFYGRTLQGTKELQARWKRVVGTTDGVLGEALGELYVARYFPPEAKTRMLTLVHNLVEALRETLNEITWMSEETRKNALIKLNAFVPMIGYPDKWEDYSQLTIDPTNFFANLQRASALGSKRDLEKIGKVVDREKWGMTPPTVNAYYSPQMNRIVFPAGILQAPFFDLLADDATNYGGIGVVIGHEMTHGFDDSGAKFDAEGNVKMWWTADDFKAFEERTAKIIEQFGGFTSQNGLKLNGKFVSGEAASDLGGIKLAYRALQKVLAATGRKTIEGFTDEQRFFLSFAQIWASVNTAEYEDYRVKADPHPMERYRVNGTLAHVAEFPKAFGLPDDCPMMLPPEKRCHVW
jgi:predicted metalloendopeptidase